MKAKITPSSQKVRIELPGTVLAQLISSGLLHGNECICLDINAKKILWKSLLTSSLNSEGQLCL